MFNIYLHNDDIQDFDIRWDQIPSGTRKIPQQNVLEVYTKWCLRSQAIKDWDNDETRYWSDDQDPQEVVIKNPKRKNVSAESKMGEYYQWRANGHCLRGDLAVSVMRKYLETEKVKDKKHNNFLLLQEQLHRQPYRNKIAEERVFQDWKAEQRVKTFWWESARNRRVIAGVLPYDSITSLNSDASMMTIVNSDILKLKGNAIKSQRKVAEKDQWTCWKKLFSWSVCPKIAFRRSLFCGKLDNWDRITPSSAPKARYIT